MAKGNDQQFESLRVVGSLLGSKVLQDVRFYKLPGQTPADYGIEKGLKLNDEMSRYWRIAQSRWQEFQQQRQRTDISQHKLAQHDWLLPLLEKVLGYEVDPSPRITLGEREFPITHTAHNKALPMVLCGADKDLDKGDAIFGQEGHKRSPMGLLQEYLNAQSQCLWAIVSNGTHLRLLRDNPAMTRPAYIEVDFARLFEEDNYADFATLWLLLHATRTAPQDSSVEKCWLEQWRGKSLGDGERVVEGLRYGVAEALRQLGTGFVAHPQNQLLRDRLSSGELTRDAYFQQVLRLVYRMLFLLTAEDRGIALLPGDEHKPARELYEKGYSISSLRDRARLKRHHDLHADAWQQLQINFTGFAKGQPLLAQPALGGLFDADQCADLEPCLLQNRYLYSALFNLGYFDHKGTRSRINYRDMNTEEFGSVYEALLELTPQLHTEGQWRFSFQGDAEGEQAASGNARKLSGSYYTPDSLVQELIKSALVPVIEARLEGKVNQQDRREALLSITVCDPACGSGHFLLGAARRLAAELAQIDADSDQPTEQHYRHALRDVLAHCIFGVDRNPMSVELARVAMWIEGVEPGRALSFLDHHLVCGDALIGITDFKQLEKGIPVAAFKPLSGDDKALCSALAKANKDGLKAFEQLRNQRQFSLGLEDSAALTQLQELEALPDNTAEEIDAKELAYVSFLQQAKESRLAHAADLLVGAFLISKNNSADPVPTSKTLYLELFSDSHNAEHQRELAAARAACVQGRVLHWPLTFPQVFSRGGFDCVLGNPPWEVSQMGEEEFFSIRDPHIARLAGDRRKKAIAALEKEQPRLWEEFIAESQRVSAANAFIRESGRYPLTAVGKLNTYPLFAETISQIAHVCGRAGFIVPTGIATDDSTKAYFAHITQSGKLVSLYDIENRDAVFPSVHRSYKFCLLTLGEAEKADFVCFASQVNHLLDFRRRFSLKPDEFRLINPNTLTCPIFRSERDAELTKKLYRASPALVEEGKPEGNPWNISFMQGTHNMSSDSHLFLNKSDSGALPLYEAKMINFYDHRAGTYAARSDERGFRVLPNPTLNQYQDTNYAAVPFYWVSKEDVHARFRERWQHDWLLVFKDVTAVTNERTVISTVIPMSGVGHTAPIIFSTCEPKQMVGLLANLNCLVLDYVARQKVGGLHLTYGYLKQFPILPLERYAEAELAFIVPRVLELTYTAQDLKPWAEDLGYTGEPFTFDPDRRAVLRAELDAWYARAYGLTRDELCYVLDPADVMGEDYPSETFRVLKKNEIKEFGEYRTRRLVLEAWNRLEQQADATKIPLRVAAQIPERVNSALLEDNSWARHGVDQRADTGLLLAAMLKASNGAVSPRKIRLAAMLAMEPRLLVPLLDEKEAALWRRLVGSEANPANHTSDFIARANQYWGAAVRYHRTSGNLLEDLQANTWSAGDGIERIITTGWYDGRASMVLEVLSRQSLELTVEKLPTELREWIYAEAA